MIRIGYFSVFIAIFLSGGTVADGRSLGLPTVPGLDMSEEDLAAAKEAIGLEHDKCTKIEELEPIWRSTSDDCPVLDLEACNGRTCIRFCSKR